MLRSMIAKKLIENGDYIPNAPFRELVTRCLKNGEIETWSDLTTKVGLHGSASTSLKRALGMQPHSGTKSCTEWIRYDLAVGIVRALDRYPVDYGV